MLLESYIDALAEEISTIKENKENAAYGILILEETFKGHMTPKLTVLFFSLI